jgi:hypothetical protein
MVGGSLRLLPPLKHDIAEILLKVALNTKNQIKNQIKSPIFGVYIMHLA